MIAISTRSVGSSPLMWCGRRFMMTLNVGSPTPNAALRKVHSITVTATGAAMARPSRFAYATCVPRHRLVGAKSLQSCPRFPWSDELSHRLASETVVYIHSYSHKRAEAAIFRGALLRLPLLPAIMVSPKSWQQTFELRGRQTSGKFASASFAMAIKTINFFLDVFKYFLADGRRQPWRHQHTIDRQS